MAKKTKRRGLRGRAGKLTECEAKARLRKHGVKFGVGHDYFDLSSTQVDHLRDAMKAAGYRRRADAPGSTPRMYYQHLNRQKSC